MLGTSPWAPKRYACIFTGAMGLRSGGVTAMNPQNRLVVASVLFAVLWTAGMVWWMGVGIASIVIFSIGGAIAGVLWYYAMRWWLRLQENRRRGG
jgi:hypothetical protein